MPAPRWGETIERRQGGQTNSHPTGERVQIAFVKEFHLYVLWNFICICHVICICVEWLLILYHCTVRREGRDKHKLKLKQPGVFNRIDWNWRRDVSLHKHVPQHLEISCIVHALHLNGNIPLWTDYKYMFSSPCKCPHLSADSFPGDFASHQLLH